MSEGEIFLVRMYRDNGDIHEMFIESADVETLKFDLKKAYNKDFVTLDASDSITVLEEIK